MAIDNKLKSAAQIRDENIKKMLDRLKEHVSSFIHVRCLIWVVHGGIVQSKKMRWSSTKCFFYFFMQFCCDEKIGFDFLHWERRIFCDIYVCTYANKHVTHIHTQTTLYWCARVPQNTTKLAEVKQIADARENEKALEKLHVFENKLFVAEQNREKEIQKKLENIRKHVRFRILFLYFPCPEDFANQFCVLMRMVEWSKWYKQHRDDSYLIAFHFLLFLLGSSRRNGSPKSSIPQGGEKRANCSFGLRLPGCRDGKVIKIN